MKMTLEKHMEFGKKLKQIRDFLDCDILNANPKNSPQTKSVLSLVKQVDRVKCHFDSVVCRDFPELPHPNKIYYGIPNPQ